MKIYDKIIRDKIPEIIKANDKNLETEIVDKKKAVEYLIKKFDEEIEEFKKEYSIEELADILEIVHGLAHNLGVDFNDLENIRRKKADDRGGFEKGIVLRRVW